MADALPTRAVDVETDDLDVLIASQPERRRRLDQIRSGRFRATLHEVAAGAAAVQTESWSCGLRVRSDRLAGYLTYAVVDPVAGEARWCGVPLAADHLLRIDQPWEISSNDGLALVAFAVDATRLAEVQDQLAGGVERRSTPAGNRCGPSSDAGALREALPRLLDSMRALPADSPALASAQGDLLHRAARLEGGGALPSVDRVAPSRRRAAVRRVEEYLDANPDRSPAMSTLCSVAGVSERTLEYAFHEHLGMTPVHFLKLRRLNRIRRCLLDPDSPTRSVAEVAWHAGVYDLGRFAGDYRALFGELPSETLRRARR